MKPGRKKIPAHLKRTPVTIMLDPKLAAAIKQHPKKNWLIQNLIENWLKNG